MPKNAFAVPSMRLLGSYGIEGNIMRWSGLLIPMCREAQINTPRRLGMFLANAIHETGGFKNLVENLNYGAVALRNKFGAHRGITAYSASILGRAPGAPPLSDERQQAVANTIYGGVWARNNLGNTQPNDGWYFRGRGLFQLTGRANHTRFARMIGRQVDHDYMSWIATPEGACQSAVHFWAASGCEKAADSGDLGAVRRIINGGDFGLADAARIYDTLKYLIDLDMEQPDTVTLLR